MVQRLPAIEAYRLLICTLSKVQSTSLPTALLNQYFDSFAANAIRRCSGRKAEVNTLTGYP
jgi:hypothetical protein